MKIYIMTDLEGISCIDNIDMIKADNTLYKYSIERLMADINAAIQGAFDGGATHVTVIDGHAGGGNFDLSLLDSRAEIDIRKNGKIRLDDSFSGILCIGYHAMAGTINGFLDHTQSSMSWFNYWVNGRRTGELGQCAIIGAHFGVPVLMVSGDEAACVEARQFFSHVECAVVKHGVGRNNAVVLDSDIALESIRNAACKAMSLVGKVKPYTPILPMEIKLELYRSDYCDKIAEKQGVERIDARTVRKVTNSYLDILF
jgi:D-amino peptidase